jgi:pilus assembly protein CpaC
MNLSVLRKGLMTIGILLMPVLAGISFAGVPTEVVISKSTLINLKKPIERVTVARPEIADVVVIAPAQIQVNGMSTGSTTIIVWEKGEQKPSFFDVKVVGDVSQIEPQIKALDPNAAITVDYAKDSVVLGGTAANPQTVAKAVDIAQAFVASKDKVINHIRVDNPDQVLLEVKVAQVDKTALKEIGISYMIKGATAEGFGGLVGAPSNSASTVISGGATSTVQNPNQGIAGDRKGVGSFFPLDPYQIGVSYFPAGVGAVIKALESKGFAKILAEPNLLVKSGQEGNIHAGQKIPYTVLVSSGGNTTTSIVFEDVGVKLKFKPEVMENGLIRLKIDPAEVSSIAGTMQVNGYPIIDIREVRTNVELKDGESLVIAGLLQEETIKSMSKIPIFGDIPIIGALFRSTDDELKNKELVFFITPKLIKPLPVGTKAILPTDNVPTPEQERDLRWVPTGN